MRALAVLLTLGLAAPASAQVPCGVVDPCPTATATPMPVPEPTATPSPTPDVPVTIVVRKTPRYRLVDDEFVISGHVEGPGLDHATAATEPPLELVSISTRYRRVFGVDQITPGPDGTFSAPAVARADTTFVIRVRAGGGFTAPEVTRRVRALAPLVLEGGYDDARPIFEVFFQERAPSSLSFEDGRLRTSGFPKRVWLYVGRGEVLRRFATKRLRSYPDGDRRGTRYARFRIPVRRLPRTEFRYAACFNGPGAAGLSAGFVGCGKRRLRF